jgi:outer membrane protein assembly factor BamB
VIRRFLFAFTAIVTVNAYAVAPQFWRVRSAEEFLAGDIEGFAVTSRGELRPAPSVRKIASFTDPFVLSQTAGANGDLFFGTGNEGKIYRLRGGDLKLIHTASEPEIYSVAYRDGSLYAASSPNGKIYKIDPESGKATAFYDPKQAYIWSMLFLPNGDLVIGSGVEG